MAQSLPIWHPPVFGEDKRAERGSDQIIVIPLARFSLFRSQRQTNTKLLRELIRRTEIKFSRLKNYIAAWIYFFPLHIFLGKSWEILLRSQEKICHSLLITEMFFINQLTKSHALELKYQQILPISRLHTSFQVKFLLIFL